MKWKGKEKIRVKIERRENEPTKNENKINKNLYGTQQCHVNQRNAMQRLSIAKASTKAMWTPKSK